MVRGPGLAQSMSRYLIGRIEHTANITLHVHTQVVGLEGAEHLESLWAQGPNGLNEKWAVRHLFLMTGANPNTKWLAGRFS